ncbi:MAG: FtsX-like permease family protein [Reyranellaceae bacterium]
MAGLGLSAEIALSHLLRRRRQSFVSVLGVALGVGFFIAMAAMMQGFQKDFVARVIDVQPHVVVKDEFRRPPRQPIYDRYPAAEIGLRGIKPREEVRGIRNARAVMDRLHGIPGVALAPTLSGQVLLRFGARDVAATAIGIEPTSERRVSNLEKDLVAGTLESLLTAANGIILGEGVAQKAGVGMDDLISVVSPDGTVMKMKVVGIVSTGITTVDNFETYMLLKKAQILQGRPDVINRIRLKLQDVEQAQALAARIEGQIGYRTEAWQESNSNVLGIFVIQNAIMYSTVGAILLVACFGIFNIISTVVFEKSRDIAIIKAIGFPEAAIRRIFVLEGLAVGCVGTLCGWMLGLALTEILASIDFRIEGFIKTQGFILHRTVAHYLIAGGFSIVAATFAAWLPARRAARLNPVDIVRGAA